MKTDPAGEPGSGYEHLEPGGAHLRGGAGLVAAGPHQVRRVGQVDEQLLLRPRGRSRKIQQEHLRRREPEV